MIGVDTNILLRLYVHDDERQHRASQRFFAARSPADRAYVGLVVLLEAGWTLGRVYGYPREDVLQLLGSMTETTDMLIENADLVSNAIRTAEAENLDFADVLLATLSRAAGCSHTVTFDQEAARRVPGMELLA